VQVKFRAKPAAMQDKQRASVECSCSIVKVADMLSLTIHKEHDDKMLSAFIFSAIHAHADQTRKKVE
jgi:redox-regulated HSP33 family molecular chaperone